MDPLVFEPYARQQIWGQRRLESVLGKRLPPTSTFGESWEISAHPHHVSRVAEGPLVGKRLDELWHERRADIAGHTATAIDRFPFDAGDETRQPWVIFCADEPTRDELVEAAASLDDSADPVAAGPGVVYWNPVKGTTTDTPFAKVLAKSGYRSRTTNRNLRTLVRIRG